MRNSAIFGNFTGSTENLSEEVKEYFVHNPSQVPLLYDAIRIVQSAIRLYSQGYCTAIINEIAYDEDGDIKLPKTSDRMLELLYVFLGAEALCFMLDKVCRQLCQTMLGKVI